MGFRIPEWVHEPLEHRNARVLADLSDDWAEEMAMGAGADEASESPSFTPDANHAPGHPRLHVDEVPDVGARSHSHTHRRDAA
jgi:hypothetical protein